MDIRFFEPGDADAVVDLLHDMSRHYNGDSASTRDVVRANLFVNILGEDSDVRIVVAVLDGRVVGMAMFAILYPAPKERAQLFMKELYVASDCRSRGIGRQIVGWIARYAVAKNCVRFDWTVDADNQKAVAFYQSIGAAHVRDKLYFRLSGPELERVAHATDGEGKYAHDDTRLTPNVPMSLPPSPVARILDDGFAIVPDALSEADCRQLVADVEAFQASAVQGRGGHRNLFDVLPSVRDLAQHPSVRCWPAALLGPGAFAVRAILFDKTPDANWKVTWHQDLTIPVRERRDIPGFGPWSEKAGISHVQPSSAVLERMLTVRVHLDACETSNGPVRLLPGTHRHGRLGPDAIDAFKASRTPVEATCPAGGLLLMRPLVLHSSSAATHPGHRRVIHLEYAVDELPGGLSWYERWGSAQAHKGASS